MTDIKRLTGTTIAATNRNTKADLQLLALPCHRKCCAQAPSKSTLPFHVGEDVAWQFVAIAGRIRGIGPQTFLCTCLCAVLRHWTLPSPSYGHGLATVAQVTSF